MIQTYKIVHGLDDVNKSLWFQHVTETSERLTRQSADIIFNLTSKNSKLELRRNCFSYRVVNSWKKTTTRYQICQKCKCIQKQV